jgi:large subunit ribosomal protein L6
MSRVGKMPVKITKEVKAQVRDGYLQVEGPKGKLSHLIPKGVKVEIGKDSIAVLKEDAEWKHASAMQGLTRMLIHNMVHGVHVGFTRSLDIVGVGYRASVKGSVLTMTLGYSHPVEYKLPSGVTATVENNTHIVLAGVDKVLVGMVAAKVRSFREPEPYKGKGIKYTDETIIRKEGKAAGAQ